MCLLTYLPAGIAPNPVALAHGAAANPHGHGFAIIAGRRILVARGMNPTRVIAEFTKLRAQHPHGAALFHSRYATHGTIGLRNCHPFRLGKDPRTVLAHNGTLPKRVHPGPYDPRSDTRIAAEEYLPKQPFGSIDTHPGARGLASWLGSSKLVILTVDPAYDRHAYLFGEPAGQWVEEVWYSNTSYLPPALRWPTRRRRYLCGYCQKLDLDSASRYCGGCGWCFDCETAFPDCTCHAPEPGTATSRHRGLRAFNPAHRPTRQQATAP
ncbi:class II glutamine amidotransferase [Nocardia amamiensis]|uniref:class II glutamine amidotransferase n=1 Tax=Nocardia amamiensis TaxID=404578 RepID=UPI000829E5B3|nr:class II glutamine amidotransferase [Nocardia amamiensis]